MRAITVSPGLPNSAHLQEVAEPPLHDGDVLVETLGPVISEGFPSSGEDDRF
jgi:hypothetical protein